jgi:hypothetical protein
MQERESGRSLRRVTNSTSKSAGADAVNSRMRAVVVMLVFGNRAAYNTCQASLVAKGMNSVGRSALGVGLLPQRNGLCHARSDVSTDGGVWAVRIQKHSGGQEFRRFGSSGEGKGAAR